jgi:uncharacterized protein (DUF2062 family)
MSRRIRKAALIALRAARKRRGLVQRLAHSKMLSWAPEQVCRGLAVGMFWAFIPMPFQMAPAALFAWFTRANLPLALLCVWISNPLTYAPIVFLEYKIGVFLGGYVPAAALKQSAAPTLATLLSDYAAPTLTGGLFLACVMMTAGYFAGFAIAYLIKRGRRAHLAQRLKERLADKLHRPAADKKTG